jgi:phosphatidylglycerophosphatase A
LPAPRPLGRVPRLLLAGLGTGWLRPGPGTWASLSVLAVCAVAEHLGGAGLYAAGACVLLGTLVTLAYGGRAVDLRGGHDPGWVVSDEWAGQGLALLAAAPGLDPRLWLASRALFRLFDILKPGPIRRLERVPGGLGVLLDDLGAGAAAGLVVLALRQLLAA